MVTIDKLGAYHASDGKYTNKPGAHAGYDLDDFGFEESENDWIWTEEDDYSQNDEEDVINSSAAAFENQKTKKKSFAPTFQTMQTYLRDKDTVQTEWEYSTTLLDDSGLGGYISKIRFLSSKDADYKQHEDDSGVTTDRRTLAETKAQNPTS